MPPTRLVILTSDNGVTLSKVTLAGCFPKSEVISSYVVESARTPDVKTFPARIEALDHFEVEVERCRVEHRPHPQPANVAQSEP